MFVVFNFCCKTQFVPLAIGKEENRIYAFSEISVAQDEKKCVYINIDSRKLNLV